jgi:hypothetical protein
MCYSVGGQALIQCVAVQSGGDPDGEDRYHAVADCKVVGVKGSRSCKVAVFV